MACAEDNGEVIGFEEGMSWLPSQVLHEAFSSDTAITNNNNNNKRHVKNQQNQQHYRPKLPAETLSQQTKNSSKAYQKSKHNPPMWASRGSGMQAIFLESGQRSCGTGVFLPQRADTNFQPTRKPACSPVLLPSRVVQALNLNVHEIGLQLSPRKDSKSKKSKGGDSNSVKNRSISLNRNASPEKFLPKEWTY